MREPPLLVLLSLDHVLHREGLSEHTLDRYGPCKAIVGAEGTWAWQGSLEGGRLGCGKTRRLDLVNGWFLDDLWPHVHFVWLLARIQKLGVEPLQELSLPLHLFSEAVDQCVSLGEVKRVGLSVTASAEQVNLLLLVHESRC